jgi:DNA polymerase III subunit delta'
MNSPVYPWLKTPWNKLALIPKTFFPHALIICGMNGIGKYDFSKILSQSLLCVNPKNEGLPCGSCSACVQYVAASNGDFLQLDVIEGKKSIGVDQIREMIHWINLTHQGKQKKILLIPQASQMTVQASNALLKTLEEPPANVVIILISEHIKSLLATIRSRCQIIALASPDKETIIQWMEEKQSDWKLAAAIDNSLLQNQQLLLSLAGNAPLKVKQLLTSDELNQRKMIVEQLIAIMSENKAPVLVSAQLSKLEMTQVLYWFQSILFDLIYIHFKLDIKQLINKDYSQQLKMISISLNSLLLFELIKELSQYYQYQGNSLNMQLLLDSYLIKWRNCSNML